MCSKLINWLWLAIIVSCILIARVSADELPKIDVLYSASTKSEIKAWAAGKGTSFRDLDFKGEEKEAIVVLIDNGRGVAREDIYVFHFEKKKWCLCLLRISNSAVDVKNSGKALIFKDDKGKILVQLPFEAM